MSQESTSGTEPIHCLSMGAGVQTTAILIKFWERYKNGYIIFADTGDEKKETYWYVEKYLKPFCKEKGLKWITVHHKHGFSLMEWCIKRKILPIRSRRWCTADFKVKPINRFLRSIGATKKNPVIEDIGFSLDESHRMHSSKYDVQYIKKEYPLLDHNLTRNDCYKIIKNHGWPLPVRSGCDFCMFNNRKHFRKLYANDPKRFHEIVLMEQNDRYYPKKPLIGNSPLENLEKNQSLDDYADVDDDLDSCDSGHCFT